MACERQSGSRVDGTRWVHVLATPRRDFTAGTRFSPPSSLSRTFNEPAGERNTRGCVPLPRNDICSVELRGTRATVCIMRDRDVLQRYRGSLALSPQPSRSFQPCVRSFSGELRRPRISCFKFLSLSLSLPLFFFTRRSFKTCLPCCASHSKRTVRG